MSNFLTEVREHPRFREFLKKDPVAGKAMFLYYAGCFERDWPGFIEERDKLRQAVRFQSDAYSEKKTFRQVATYPPIVSEWIKFLNFGGEPSKEFHKKFIEKHKEYWIVDKI